MNRFKQTLMGFLQGRYGIDQLTRFIIYVSLGLMVFTLFFHNSLLYLIAVIGIIYAYFRIFSKNISKRYSENQAYLRLRYKVVGKFNNWKLRMKDSRTHRIFRCPSCGQKIRVPRNKGKISIKCPKCRIEFVRKS